jgi:hypothetical protein
VDCPSPARPARLISFRQGRQSIRTHIVNMNNGQMAVGKPSDPWSLATGLALTQAAKRVSITPRPRLSRCAQVRTRDSTTRGARRPAARSQHGADSQNAQSAVRRRPASERSATTRASTAIISPARCTGCKSHAKTRSWPGGPRAARAPDHRQRRHGPAPVWRQRRATFADRAHSLSAT